MPHVFHDRTDGLKHCKICGGAEGSLPTDCPGVKMTPEQDDAVYQGLLDYTGGAWAPGQHLERYATALSTANRRIRVLELELSEARAASAHPA